MRQWYNSSPNQGLLRRPRLQALIHDGLRHPLVVMLAGPGYGKTQAMAGYLAESGAKAIWLRLTGLDNLPTHFWNHVMEAFLPECPGLSSALSSLGFPSTLPRFEAFIHLLDKHYTEDKPLIWVFDDLGVISNDRIKNFFQMLVMAELKKFPLVLISNQLNGPDSVAFLSSRQFLLLADDLRFTRSEIAQLYQMYGLPLEPGELDNIEQLTEGWALALHLLVQTLNKTPPTSLPRENTLSHMFEERFFSNHSKGRQLLLTRLSLLNHFSRELALELYDGDPAELDGLAGHPFLTNEPSTGRLFWHHLYHLFLQKKQSLLTAEDRRRTWQKAADHYRAAGDAMEAVRCLHQSGDHAGMLKTISGFAMKMAGIGEKEADFLLEHLDHLTPEEIVEYPVADYFRAHIYMNILEVEKAEFLLLNLEKRLLERERPDETTLLGDVYVALGLIHMMRTQPDYGDFFQKADAYLPAGSSFFDRRTLAIGNNNCFGLGDNLPGARERQEQAAHKAAPWINRVLRGCMSGMEHIISAESAFMICDFEAAREQALLGLNKAAANAQHDYALNGLLILARIGWLRGDLAEISRRIQSIVDYAGEHDIAVLNEIRDTILTWHYVKLRDFNRLPKSIITPESAERPLPTYGRPQIVYGNYLIAMEEYARLVSLLEQPKGLFLAGGIWHDRICLLIMLAIGHQRLGNLQAALKHFWTVYDMCHRNEVHALFIEAGEHMSPLIRLARQQHTFEFSPSWLDFIYSEAADYARTADQIRTEYRALNPAAGDRNNPLSRREKAVLQALSQGLTREEIALKQKISVNTVKGAIRSIYTKLNANNRAEAVSIALARGYIEGYLPE